MGSGSQTRTALQMAEFRAEVGGRSLPKRKLENGDQRLAPETQRSRTETREIAYQRLGRIRKAIEMSAVLTHPEITPQRPHRLAGSSLEQAFTFRHQRSGVGARGGGDDMGLLAGAAAGRGGAAEIL